MNITDKLYSNNRPYERSKCTCLQVLDFKETYSWFFIIAHFDGDPNFVSICNTSGVFQEFILYRGDK